jgi:hypothetical protein
LLHEAKNLKLSANLSESFDYTKLLFKDIQHWIMLIIFSAIPVVNLVFLGYLGDIMKRPKNSKELPKLDNYEGLLIQGLKMGIVSIVYMIVPLCIMMMGYDIFNIFSFIDLRGRAATAVMLVGALIMLGVSIILAMALVKLVKEGNNINEAFAFGEPIERVKKVGWVPCVLGAFLIAFTTGIIVYILNVVFSRIADGVLFSVPALAVTAILLLPIFGIFVARSATLTYLEGEPTQETAPPTEQP